MSRRHRRAGRRSNAFPAVAAGTPEKFAGSRSTRAGLRRAPEQLRGCHWGHPGPPVFRRPLHGSWSGGFRGEAAEAPSENALNSAAGSVLALAGEKSPVVAASILLPWCFSLGEGRG